MVSNTTQRMTVQERWAKKIRDANILDRLIKHVNGQLDPPMEPSAVQAAMKLVGKIMPDLKSTEITGTIGVKSMNRLELEGRLLQLGIDPNSVWQKLEGRAQVIDSKVINGQSSDKESIDEQQQAIEFIEETEPGTVPVD